MLVLQIVAARIVYEVFMALLSLTPWYWRLVNKVIHVKMKTLLPDAYEDDLE